MSDYCFVVKQDYYEDSEILYAGKDIEHIINIYYEPFSFTDNGLMYFANGEFKYEWRLNFDEKEADRLSCKLECECDRDGDCPVDCPDNLSQKILNLCLTKIEEYKQRKEKEKLDEEKRKREKELAQLKRLKEKYESGNR